MANERKTTLKGNENTVGDGNISVNIEGDLVLGKENKRKVNQSILYEVCVDFLKASNQNSLKASEEYSTQHNSDWFEKLEYNKVDELRELLDYYGVMNLKEVQLVLDKLDSPDELVMFIHSKYKEVKVKNKEKTKDEMLLILYDILYDILKKSQDNSEDKYILYDEEINKYVYSLIFYCFTKCKVLDPIPKKEVKT